jgi:hypothetical protein
MEGEDAEEEEGEGIPIYLVVAIFIILAILLILGSLIGSGKVTISSLGHRMVDALNMLIQGQPVLK